MRENEARYPKKTVELILNLDITAKDLELAHEIYGDVRLYVAGCRMKRNPVHHPVDEELKSQYKSVTMHSDVMYYWKKLFFVCVY